MNKNFDNLPTKVQQEVHKKLTNSHTVSVWFDNGKYQTTEGQLLRDTHPVDFVWWGLYNKSNIYNGGYKR